MMSLHPATALHSDPCSSLLYYPIHSLASATSPPVDQGESTSSKPNALNHLMCLRTLYVLIIISSPRPMIQICPSCPFSSMQISGPPWPNREACRSPVSSFSCNRYRYPCTCILYSLFKFDVKLPPLCSSSIAEGYFYFTHRRDLKHYRLSS